MNPTPTPTQPSGQPDAPNPPATVLERAKRAAEEIVDSTLVLAERSFDYRPHIAAIIARHFQPQAGEQATPPQPSRPSGEPSDTEMMNLLRKGCTLWLLTDGRWELTTKAGEFSGTSLDEVCRAALQQSKGDKG